MLISTTRPTVGRRNLDMNALLYCAALLFVLNDYATTTETKPNIVLILADDQDIELYGMYPMTKTRRLLAHRGASFSRAFVTTPLCCPSRSSILSGLYTHNHRTVNNSVSGGCSSIEWQQNIEQNETFATYLQQHGYITFYAGKYLNRYGKKQVGGIKHVPAGWDWWNGLVGNSVYYNYRLSVNGTKERHGNESQDYLTKVIGRKAVDFLSKMSVWHPSKPILLVLCPPAPHAPFTSAAVYEHQFERVRAPRTSSFGRFGSDKHWLIRQATHPINQTVVQQIDAAYRNRWRTLLSVDDLVENVVNALETNKQLDNTYIMYTSDNGYHVGQFCLPLDKRQLYEFDVKVPLLLRGPGIKEGSHYNQMVLNIDIAPTLLDLAGVTVPETMDGRSMLDLLGPKGTPKRRGRSHFLLEYWGEQNNSIPPSCSHLRNRGVSDCKPGCVCEDAVNNTYACVRMRRDKVFCRFEDAERFVEYYDMRRDPGQLRNLAAKLSAVKEKRFDYMVRKLQRCRGHKCH